MYFKVRHTIITHKSLKYCQYINKKKCMGCRVAKQTDKSTLTAHTWLCIKSESMNTIAATLAKCCTTRHRYYSFQRPTRFLR